MSWKSQHSYRGSLLRASTSCDRGLRSATGTVLYIAQNTQASIHDRYVQLLFAVCLHKAASTYADKFISTL